MALTDRVNGENIQASFFNDIHDALENQVLSIQTASGAGTITSEAIVLCDTTSGAFTLGLPAAASNTGKVYYLKHIGATTDDVTIDPDGAETINGVSALTLSDKVGIVIVCDGTQWFVVDNDILIDDLRTEQRSNILSVQTVTGTTTLAGNAVILCDTTSGAITLNLPAAADNTGKLYHIKHINASTDNVTIDPNASETIDGQSALTVSPNVGVIIACDGTEWFVIDNDQLITNVSNDQKASIVNVQTVTGTTTANQSTIILCDTTSGAFTLNLPAAADNTGKMYFIKHINATSDAVTVDPNASETIDGQATYNLAANVGIVAVCNGTLWNIVDNDPIIDDVREDQKASIVNVQTVTTNDTADQSSIILCDTTSGNLTLTLPAASSNSGKMYYIKHQGVNNSTVTIDANASETIDGNLTYLLLDGIAITIFCDGSNWFVLENGKRQNSGTTQLYLTSTIVSSGASYTKLNFNNVVINRTGAYDSGNTRIVAQTDGEYLVGSEFIWGNSAAGTSRDIAIFVNGSMVFNHFYPVLASSEVVTISQVLQLNANDYVEIHARQDSGGNITVSGGQTQTTFYMKPA